MTTPRELAHNAAYESRPVILVHLVASLDSDVPWCNASHSYIPDDGEDYFGVPRVLCPACAKAPVEYPK
jgi:hypothetical protein